MRRIYAFAILAVTILAIAIINFKPIFDLANLGTEFRGGREIVYKVTDEDGNDITDSKIIADASKQILNRLDIAGVSNNYVTIEGDNHFSLIIPSKAPTIIDHIKEIIEADTTISFVDSNSNLIAKGEDILETKGIYLYFNSDGAPRIDLKIKNTEKWGEITNRLATSEDNQLIIWVDFVEGEDNLDNLNSLDEELVEDTQERIISRLSIDEETREKNVTYSGSFSEELANKYNDLISAGNIDYKFEFIAIYDVEAYYGSQAYFYTLLALAIGILLTIILLIYLYGLPGIGIASSLILFIAASLGFFNILKGEFGPSSICALLIAIGVAVDASIVTIERIKEELYKGRNLVKAFSEGTKKSLSTVMDSNIIILIIAFSLYAIGTRSIKNFSTMLVVCSLTISIILVLLSRLTFGLLCKSKDLENKKHLFGVDPKLIPNLANDEVQTYFGKYADRNFLKYNNLAKKVFPAIITVGLVLFAVFTLTMGSGLNFKSQYTTGTSVSMTSLSEEFANEDNLKEIFKTTDGLNVNTNIISINYNEDDSLYYINVRTASKLSEDQIEVLNNKIEEINEEINANFTTETPIEVLFIGDVNALIPIKIIINAILGSLIAIGGMIIYLTIRFRFTYMIAGITTLFVDVLVALSIIVIFRVQIGMEFITALLAVGALSIYDKTILFDRIREVKLNYKKQEKITIDDRREMVNKALQLNNYRSMIIYSIVSLILISLIVFSNSISFGLYFILIAGFISTTRTTMYLLPIIWINLENRFEERKKIRVIKKKEAKKKVKKSSEPEEFVFYGIND